MNDLKRAAQRMLDAIEDSGHKFDVMAATEALRAALAQEQAEPVAWTLTETLDKRETTTNGYLWFSDPVNSSWTPLYTTPPQRLPLTQEESDNIYREFMLYQDRLTPSVLQRVVRAVERAHGIGRQMS